MAGISGKRTYLREVNPHLTCPLCRGYLIDATTVVECLHSFCRSCILKHLSKDAQCPVCKHLLNTAKPNIKADKTLQDIVYKLVPGLYHKEMRRRREFYAKHPEHGLAARACNHLGGADAATPEQRGEDVSGRLIFAPEDAISLSLEYLPAGADPLELLVASNAETCDGIGSAKRKTTSPANKNNNNNSVIQNGTSRRYLQCPALVTIAHLKKFLALKYAVDVTKYSIDICHRRAPLPEHWTLMDVAYIFAWKRNAPIRFFYRVTPEEMYLEAPPNDRPSTPGLGASQPLPIEQASVTNEKAKLDVSASKKSEQRTEAIQKPATPKSLDKSLESTPVVVIKRSPKEGSVSKSPDNVSSSSSNKSPPSTTKREDAALKQQVKSPLKIAKNSDGRYQVLQGPSLPAKDDAEKSTNNCKTPAPPAAKFSVVSINDGANSNGFKITIKQCSPLTTVSSNAVSNQGVSPASSKKPKVISNVLLSKPDSKPSEEKRTSAEDKSKHEQKLKRKVHFVDSDAPKAKKPVEQSDKKQFLHGFRLTAKQVAAAAAQNNSNNNKQQQQQQHQEVTNSEQKVVVEAKKSTNDVKNPTNSQQPKESSEEKKGSPVLAVSSPKKRQPEGVKVTSTNIADRIGDKKQLIDGNSSQKISSSSEGGNEKKPQQAIDVYAFPNDPPASVPPGAIKRKCPPGLPIFDVRKKQQQTAQSASPVGGKKTAVKAGTPVKCYRNQTKHIAPAPVKPTPPQSPVRPQQPQQQPQQQQQQQQQSTPSPASNNSIASPAVSSTSPKKSSPLISNDTRNLLDGCGLNIPASLSITLTSPKASPVSRPPDPAADARKEAPRQTNFDESPKFNPSITLNDRSVDPRVLKALKSGQMRMPASNAKPKVIRPITPDQQQQQQKQGPPAKRKKDEPMMPPAPPKTSNLPGSKQMDMQTLKIPIPNIAKNIKIRPVPNWSQFNNTKPKDLEGSPANGQVVTLADGQRFYRAPPGSLTPAAHRINDAPTMPSRAPVYAPSAFSNSSGSPMSRPPSSFSVFPSLQSLYALNQAPSLEQFHMDSRLRAVTNSKESPTSTANKGSSNAQTNKSHLAAQCAPVKPSRTFALPIAKQSVVAKVDASAKPAANQSTSIDKSETTSKTTVDNTATISTSSTTNASSIGTSDDTGDRKPSKSDSSKEALPKAEKKEREIDAASMDEKSSSQDAASPRVTSTASPSPPPSVSTTDSSVASASESQKPQSSTSEAANIINKSPESPDSSSVVTESGGGDPVADSTRPSIEKDGKISPSSSIKNDEGKDERRSEEKKNNSKVETSEQLEKPTSAGAWEERFLAAFPSNEWAREGFGSFLKTVAQVAEAKSKNAAEAQSKNAKAVQ